MKEFMEKMSVKWILMISLLVQTSVPLSAQRTSEFNEYDIAIPADSSRTYLFTNQQDSYWFGESNRYHNDSEYGWNFRHQQVLYDVLVSVDGIALSRESAQSTVSPVLFTRKYKDKAVVENLYFLHNQRTLVIEIVPDTTRTISVVPIVTSTSPQTERHGNVISVTQQKYVTRSGLPVRLFMESSEPGTWTVADSSELRSSIFSLGSAPVRWEGTISDTCRFYITLSDDIDHHRELVSSWETDLGNQIRQTKDMTNLIRTDNVATNQALFWAQYQLQNLFTTMHGDFILPELPGGDWYQSREALMSIPGLLAAREFPAVRAILQTMISWQITDENSPDYGLIPGQVLPGCRMYKAADVTPLLGIMLSEYLKYSGDFGFAQEIYRASYHAIEGALEYRSDDNGFLLNQDGGTWMNAQTADGYVTPRGNRAVEIQVLWYRQLLAGSALASELGYEDTSNRWRDAARKVRVSFAETFWNSGTSSLYDHINPDNIPDQSIRPNQIFAISQTENLLPVSRQESILQTVLRNNYLPSGITTLSKSSENFHPYISVLPYYSRNEALHNGMIWTWLNGPMISGLVKFGLDEMAYSLTENMTDEVLNENIIGSLGQFKNVITEEQIRSLENSSIGTASVAKKSYGPALSEYIRSWYQDYLGIHPDAIENLLVLKPQLPENIGSGSTDVSVGNNRLNIEYIKTDERFTFRLRNSGNPVDIQLQLRNGDSVYVLPRTFQLGPTNAPVSIHFNYANSQFSLGNTRINTNVEAATFSMDFDLPVQSMPGFAAREYPVFRLPDYPMLDGSEITHNYDTARPIVDVKDPTGDHYGPGALYRYPLHPSYDPGMYDLTGFAVRTDDDYYYFDIYYDQLPTEISDSEFALPDVFTVVGIHTGDSTGISNFGYNSDYNTPIDKPVQYIMYIGNGIRLIDAKENVLLGYIPVQDGYSVIHREQSKIQIAIPTEMFPQVKRWWEYTVLTGVSEDFNGNGIGAFRTVLDKPCLWYGGGKKTPGDPNWYDILQIGSN